MFFNVMTCNCNVNKEPVNLYCHETVPDPLQFSSNKFFNQSIKHFYAGDGALGVEKPSLEQVGFPEGSRFKPGLPQGLASKTPTRL